VGGEATAKTVRLYFDRLGWPTRVQAACSPAAEAAQEVCTPAAESAARPNRGSQKWASYWPLLEEELASGRHTSIEAARVAAGRRHQGGLRPADKTVAQHCRRRGIWPRQCAAPPWPAGWEDVPAAGPDGLPAIRHDKTPEPDKPYYVSLLAELGKGVHECLADAYRAACAEVGRKPTPHAMRHAWNWCAKRKVPLPKLTRGRRLERALRIGLDARTAQPADAAPVAGAIDAGDLPMLIGGLEDLLAELRRGHSALRLAARLVAVFDAHKETEVA
jgi:hypothetical protein